MATFNGSLYLREQLDSIAAQTRLPTELVVCDDASSDDTALIVKTWAANAPFPVQLHVNPLNLGVAENFERAVSLCTGSYVSLADQDDVWHPAKLATAVSILDSRPAVGLVFSDACVVSDDLQPRGYGMWETRRFRHTEQRLMQHGRAVDVLVRRNVVMGATMTFRSCFRNLLLPLHGNRLHLHDGWIAFLLASVSEIAPVATELAYYRQRVDQQVGAHPPTHPGFLLQARRSNSWSSNMEAKQLTLEWFLQLQQRLLDFRSSYGVPDRVFALLQGKIDHHHARLEMPRARLPRALFVAANLACLRYHRYSIGMWAAVQDLSA